MNTILQNGLKSILAALDDDNIYTVAFKLDNIGTERKTTYQEIITWKIAMYYLDTKQHKCPLIHIKYGEQGAVYQIPGGYLPEVTLPANKERLLHAWIEIHKEELMANRQLAVTGNRVFTIDPLK